MTNAEKIVEKGKLPADLSDAGDDVLAVMEAAAAAPEAASRSARRFLRASEKLKDSDPDRAAEAAEIASQEAAAAKELNRRRDEEGLHAYRYEVMPDNSVLAIYTKTVGELSFKAFPNLEEASEWSPRDEE